VNVSRERRDLQQTMPTRRAAPVIPPQWFPRDRHQVAFRAQPAWDRRPHRERLRLDPNRKLYRSKANRKLAGVCGGLAQYLNVDATVIRVLFVLLAVLGGSGLVLYLAMWIMSPTSRKAARIQPAPAGPGHSALPEVARP
jgi:phage shock protein C